MEKLQDKTPRGAEEGKRNWIGTSLAGVVAVGSATFGILFWVLDWKSSKDGYLLSNMGQPASAEGIPSLYFYASQTFPFWMSRIVLFLAAGLFAAACAWKPLTQKYSRAAGIAMGIFSGCFLSIGFEIFWNGSAVATVSNMMPGIAPSIDRSTPLIISIPFALMGLAVCLGILLQHKYSQLAILSPFIFEESKEQSGESAA